MFNEYEEGFLLYEGVWDFFVFLTKVNTVV